MEVETSLRTSPRVTPSPESLRRRQRDRLAPRGLMVKDNRMAKNGQRVQAGHDAASRLSPTSRTDAMGRLSPEAARKVRRQDDTSYGNYTVTRSKDLPGDTKIDILPDGLSAGREGRQFTVANVGNNGKIYLRPTVRSANQRYHQPKFIFPIKQPNTADLDASSNEEAESHRDSLWTGTQSPGTTPIRRVGEQFFPASTVIPSKKPERKRAHSYSTVDEQRGAIQFNDVGAFKVVIDRVGTDTDGVGRPRTAEEIGGMPQLEVPIPSYKLGTPSFSTRGTAFLRAASYNTNDELCSSVFSQGLRDTPCRNGNTLVLDDPGRSRRHSHASSQPHFVRVSQALSSNVPLSPASTMMLPLGPIEPAMFDSLTFKPSCDDRSLVRYSSCSGSITAATPARLVAEITSQTFVDYDLLSDFFLTFRSFLSASDLLAMLIARLRWALARNEETGMVVRVRTFVAIRHWILNYFMDDYVLDFELRQEFCIMLNSFVQEISQQPTTEKNHLKILGELKKCWRRTCALYWDGPDFRANAGPEVPIVPGGVAGSRDPHLTPSIFEDLDEKPPQLDSILRQDMSTTRGYNLFADIGRAGHVESTVMKPQVGIPYIASEETDNDRPLSFHSMASVDALSCSFPSRSKIGQLGSRRHFGAHPVTASSNYDSSPSVAYNPKATSGKRSRPSHAHKRSGSFSDSLRDDRIRDAGNKAASDEPEFVMALPYGGSLVRGNLFPPGQAFVEVIAPSTPAEIARATTYFVQAHTQKESSGMSGPAMKKLLGSVRRALSTKAGPSPDCSPAMGSFPHMPLLAVRGATINRLPGTAVVPQHHQTGARAPMRIDILGAGIAEDFKKAVREDAEADAERRTRSSNQSIGVASRGNEANYPSINTDEADDGKRPWLSRAPTSGLTNGSKSIVIFDETLLPDGPVMTGALRIIPSTDTFTNAYMHPSAGPTPPSTPPEHHFGSPRRSSQLLGQSRYNINRSLSPERTPSLVRDVRSPSDVETSPGKPLYQPSLYRQSYRSNKSVSLRRYASYQSGFTRHVTERSFDATTFSGSGDRDTTQSHETPPPPPRVLRRRPGGDLRAVTNVGDLGTLPLRRVRSTSSMTTYSNSMHSSSMFGRDSTEYVNVTSNADYSPGGNTGPFSLGALADAVPKKEATYFSTHSSQPVMRPSFELEAKKLAEIPDDIDDDGGVESALLKLEGKFEQRRSNAGSAVDTQTITDSLAQSFGTINLVEPEHDNEKRRHRQKHIVEHTVSKIAPQLETPRGSQNLSSSDQQPSLKPASYERRMFECAIKTSHPKKPEGSYPSKSLSPREAFSHRGNKRQSRIWTGVSILRDPSNERDSNVLQRTSNASHPSIDFVDETDSMKRIPVGETRPRHSNDDQSFLDSQSDDNDSDLSSELSLEVISRNEYTFVDSDSTFPRIRAGTVIKEVALPYHPLRHPSSSTMTMDQALGFPSKTPQIPLVSSEQLHVHQQQAPYHALPLTPQVTPPMFREQERFGNNSRGNDNRMGPLCVIEAPSQTSRMTSVHLPFILAFDSKVLAQQFTLIEKDALNEIDWKELIDMKWRHATIETRSWVEFLRTQEARGVEVVIARFNIMVKWAVSECVLTQDLEERVRAIIKFIHIAAHCRRYRNYATMYQLTIALTSTELTRLTNTWSHVPAPERKILKELEALVQPTRNFHDLRAEMEGAGVDHGCIPFVGIYTHDLLFNSQRPSQIASTPTTEPLVNFEKCRTMATVVKNLLRLLEASSLYRFQPVEGITERCLWIAALSDAEIRRCGAALE